MYQCYNNSPLTRSMVSSVVAIENVVAVFMISSEVLQLYQGGLRSRQKRGSQEFKDEIQRNHLVARL
ncbi:hypothetical protein BJX99DRAFT_71813 [Aspergillus californicus]